MPPRPGTRRSPAGTSAPFAGEPKIEYRVIILTAIGPFTVLASDTNATQAVSSVRRAIMNSHLLTDVNGDSVRLEMDHVVGYRINN